MASQYSAEETIINMLPRLTSPAQFAAIIQAAWPKPYFGAIPYIQAMAYLDTIASYYGLDDGRDIVNRFLANAQTWRGPLAKAVKARLNQLLRHPVSSMD
jgi:hypothetical protein